MRRGILVCALALAAAACGSNSPAAPSAPATAVNPAPLNVTGTWGEKGGGTLVWQLQQNGTTVTGTSSFTDRNAVMGGYIASGPLSGTISASGLTTKEVDQVTQNSPNGTVFTDCVETITSTWTFTSATEMTGPFSQSDTCGGAVVFTKSGTATLVKQ